MLTATYSLVAIAIEQKQALRCLDRISKAVAALWQVPLPLEQ